MLRITQVPRYLSRAQGDASMRPQRNAADNLRLSPKELREIHNASMRPQRNAADNGRMRVGMNLYYFEASMRPQRNAADNWLMLMQLCLGRRLQ